LGRVGFGGGGSSRTAPLGMTKEEEEEKSLIKDLKRYAQLAVAWDRHGSLVPKTPTLLVSAERGLIRREEEEEEEEEEFNRRS
jgi:hypothetical protein